jgi:multicomponent Na+:H+ antiporter subunit D
VGGWNATIGIQQWFDSLSWISFALVLFVAFMTLLYAIAEGKYGYTFYFVYLVMLAGTAGALLAADLFNLIVCFEILGIASYILIAYIPKGHAVMASFQYLVLSSLGMALFLIGIFILYQHTGTLAIVPMSQMLEAAQPLSPQISIAVSALIAGLGVRTAFFRFHTWLPDAHAYAPHPVSAMLSGILLKISFITIWRFVLMFHMQSLQVMLLWLGAITALLGVGWALMQTDCKKLLAWHSISQMGYILAGFGAGTPLGLTASFLHTINHGVFKSLLFLSVGSVMHATGERNLKRLGALSRKLPLLAIVFSAGALSIAGIPPFNGFVSKKLLFTSVKTSPIIYYTLWLAGIGTIASFAKLSGIFRPGMFRPHGGLAPGAVPIRQPVARLTYVPLCLMALFCLTSGIFGTSITSTLSAFLLGEAVYIKQPLYSLANIQDTALSLGLGIVLYIIATHARVQNATTRLSHMRVSLNSALLWLVLGFIGLSIVSIFHL